MSKSRLFYGWYIAGIAFIANFMTTGTHFYIFNAFMEPLCSARGWTRTEINVAMVLGSMIGIAGQFVFGTLVMRSGPRVLMLCGSIAAGFSFIFMGRVETLWIFYICYVSLYVSNMAYGGIVASTAVSNWFVIKRGKALGFSTMGISLSGAVLPFTAMLILMYADLPTASLIIGSVVLCVGPLSWAVVRNWPENKGLRPDGLPGPKVQIETTQNSVSLSSAKVDEKNTLWRLADLVRVGAFWKLGFAYGLILVGTVGTMSQLKPRFSDIGFSDMAAMMIMAATAFIGACGKYIWGALCDRFEPRRVAAVLMTMNALGLSLALVKGSMAFLFIFILVYGFAMGGIMSTYPVIIAHLFGRESFAGVTRYISMFLCLQMLGFMIAGQSYDRLGSYDAAYCIFIVLDLLAALLVFTVRTPEKKMAT